MMGPGGMMGTGGSMNCTSPAPMGGPGSFACYPAQQMGQWGPGGGMMGPGWGMMGMGMGWHPHMRNFGWYGWNPGGYGYDGPYGQDEHGRDAWERYGNRNRYPNRPDQYDDDATGSVTPPNRGGRNYDAPYSGDSGRDDNSYGQ